MELSRDHHEKTIYFQSNAEACAVFGHDDQYLNTIEKNFDVKITSRGNQVSLQGNPDEIKKVEDAFTRLLAIVKEEGALSEHDVRYVIRLAKDDSVRKGNELFQEIVVTARGKVIRPRTIGQYQYAKAIEDRSLVFGIGPAGTGKTYLAVAVAVAAFKERKVNRIILTRPAVEAGERLGFLPGTIEEKVNPYLRPLYDALFDILGADTFEKYTTRGLIEIAPLAYMRGRTLDDSFVILDEAQNTTTEQMKMFLTRLGIGSKAVVTGDITQVDLPKGTYSGLDQVRVILKDIEGISFVYLTDQDVVRHELVAKIIKAYETFEATGKDSLDERTSS